MLDVLKRHEVQVLRKAGHTLAEVAKISGVSEGSVRRIIAEPPADAAAASAGHRSNRRSG